MRRLALLAMLLFLGTATAEDLTGKTIQVKENGLKLGRRSGGGLIRDGEALDSKKTYTVKSDDGTYLELAGGLVFKFEVEVVASAPLPKKDEKAAKPKDDWTGKKVLPKKQESEIRFGDWVDAKQVYWEPHNLMNCTVRDDRDGFLRVYDMRREGWVSKDDFVTAEDAPIYWDKAVKANANDTYALYMRGMGWKGKGEYDNAIKDFNECIRLKPDSSVYYNSRGIAWHDKKEYDKAISDYTEAIRLDPKEALAYYNRGNAWRDKKEYDKAISDYTEAIRLDPKEALAYENRGNAWRDKKEYDKAISDYTEAIRLDPKNAWAYYSRSINEMLIRKKQIMGYNEVLKIELWKGEYSPFAVINGCIAARLEKDEPAAKKFLDDAKGKLEVVWPYPIVQFLRGDLDEVALLKLAVDTDKKTEAHCALGYDQLIKGDAKKAREHFEWVKKNGPSTFIEYTMAIAELDRLDKEKK